MRKIALISSFCDTEDKIEVLEKNLDLIRKMGVDTMVISPFYLPEGIVSKCNYFLKTQDNPVLTWPQRSMFYWIEIEIGGERYRMSRTYPDYGWAGLSQVKQLSNLALTLEYDQFFHLIYDTIIDDTITEGFSSNRNCHIYPSKRGNDIWEVGLHFMIFDRKNLERFISYIHLDSYLSLQGTDAFVWLNNLATVFPYRKETVPVGDEVYYYSGYDFFNYSSSDKFRVFIVKDDEFKDSVKFLFYGVKDPFEIKVKMNSREEDFIVRDYEILDTFLRDEEIEEVIFFLEDKEFNITEKIKEVKHNTLRKW